LSVSPDIYLTFSVSVKTVNDAFAFSQQGAKFITKLININQNPDKKIFINDFSFLELIVGEEFRLSGH